MPCENQAPFPCGKCPGCGATRSSDWSIRLSHEREYHDLASFITLTYRDSSILDVSRDDARTFIRRLRKIVAPKIIRFFLVSEYGDLSQRPHYHAIIFGYDFSLDAGAQPVRSDLMTSPVLRHAWPHGNVSSGSVTPASIRYVTNYLVGKYDDHEYLNLETGECRPLLPTFALMSRNPGLGAKWIEDHDAETYKDDSIQLDGFSRRPPRYYDVRTFKNDPLSLEALKKIRHQKVREDYDKDPEKYFRKRSPYHRAAESKIQNSRRKLKTGEI